MNKTAIKNFAVGARVSLISAVTQKAYEYEITKDGENTASLDQVKGRPLTPTEKSQRSQLIARINEKGFDNVMEEAAYTWFNRFTALRYMEVNGYLPSRIKVFSNESGEFKPEILSQALDVEIEGLDKAYIVDLLDAQDNDTLYKYLLIAQCNALNKGLPELFEQIGGWTELLFPNNLLRDDSVIARMVKEIPQEDWQDQVQIIGWLYQYYTTELNELVYDGRMSKDKIPKELISAATTIYTPDWSVRYMVENSLGRLWAEGHEKPANADWKYYLEEAEQEESVKAELERIRAEYAQIKPEQIKFLDPCMGSGHILVYAFDLLMDIYTQCGWSERDAAVSIISKNLYGLDIDRRAYQLAYFSLMMKVRQNNRRLLKLSEEGACTPNLANFQDIGRFSTDMLTGKIAELAGQFENCDTYGSLIDVQEIPGLDEAIDEFHGVIGFNGEQMERVMRLYRILSQKYDVVCTNPPYMGSSRFTSILADYVNSKYKDEKSDLSMVMFRHCTDHLVKSKGFVSFITTNSWFFLSSFEKLRTYIISEYQIDSIVDYGTELFEGKVGHNPIVSWVLRKTKPIKSIAAIRLVDYCYAQRDRKEPEFFNEQNRYTAKQENFSKIPGMPVAYWVSEAFVRAFENLALGQCGVTRKGMYTGLNEVFVKAWYEVQYSNIAFLSSRKESEESNLKWYPYANGGDFRKWYGNNLDVVNWEHDGARLRSERNDKGNIRAGCFNLDYIFNEGVTWTSITSSTNSMRILCNNSLFSSASNSWFGKQTLYVLAYLNSIVSMYYLNVLNPTLNANPGDIAKLPLIQNDSGIVDGLVKDNIAMSKNDWDAFETSWDFERHPLV